MTDPAPDQNGGTVPEGVGGTAPVAPDSAVAAGTGHPGVDAALERLSETRGLPPAEQVPGYEAVHRTLQETLATIDEGQS